MEPQIKYRLNENPKGSPYPVIEEVAPCGYHFQVTIFDENSMITRQNPDGWIVLKNFGADNQLALWHSYGGERKLYSSSIFANLRDFEIQTLSAEIGVSVSDLKEMQAIEKAYRQSKAPQAADSQNL